MQSKFLGTNTNNFAEYQGVLLALNWLPENLKKNREKVVMFILDSELVVRQLNGIYKIKKPELQTLSLSIKKLIDELGVEIVFKNVPRAQNKIADSLLNEELDKH